VSLPQCGHSVRHRHGGPEEAGTHASQLRLQLPDWVRRRRLTKAPVGVLLDFHDQRTWTSTARALMHVRTLCMHMCTHMCTPWYRI
jgi:hypothetical protein